MGRNGREAKVVEGNVSFIGEGLVGSTPEDEEEHFEGSEVMIAVPQQLENGKVVLVIVGQARVMKGVKLATDELKLGG